MPDLSEKNVEATLEAALLLERELLPRLPTPPPLPGRHGHWHTFRRVLSSFTATTAQWVQVLTDLTGRPDLARLTLLPWQAVLPPATLRRYTHAWCPQWVVLHSVVVLW